MMDTLVSAVVKVVPSRAKRKASEKKGRRDRVESIKGLKLESPSVPCGDALQGPLRYVDILLEQLKQKQLGAGTD